MIHWRISEVIYVHIYVYIIFNICMSMSLCRYNIEIFYFLWLPLVEKVQAAEDDLIMNCISHDKLLLNQYNKKLHYFVNSILTIMAV